LKRAYAKRHDSHKPEPTQPAVLTRAPGGVIQLALDRDALLDLMQDSLESLALKLGMLVASSLLEDEVTRLCGARYERQAHRTHTRYGHQRGTATLAGQKIAIARPRVRRTNGGGEGPLETYARLQSPHAMPQAVLRRMARGVSTRDYADVIDLTPEGFGVKKSSVSRDFVRASAAQVKALAERRFDGTHFPVILIDGVEYAGETMIVAAGITADGTKRVLGLRQGATEAAKASLEATARWLDRINPDAASSLREGLEETLTVVRLGLAGALRRTLATTNPIESALSVTRRVTARVTRWRDGDMRRRWCVAGLLRAESKFRRVKGHRALPTLIKALEQSTRARRSGIERGVA